MHRHAAAARLRHKQNKGGTYHSTRHKTPAASAGTAADDTPLERAVRELDTYTRQLWSADGTVTQEQPEELWTVDGADADAEPEMRWERDSTSVVLAWNDDTAAQAWSAGARAVAGQRRLLETQQATENTTPQPATALDVRIDFGLEDPEAATAAAEALRAALADPTSDVATTLRYRISRIAHRHTARQLSAEQVQVAQVATHPLHKCAVDNAWKQEFATGELGAAGWLSCSARAVGGEDPVPLSPRGAQTAADWQLFDAQNAKVFDAALGLAPAQYSLALDAQQAERHWQFWDFCAPRPRGAAVSAETWHRVRALVEGHCCACRRGTEAPASWPIAPDAPLPGADSARLVPVHPQARDDSWRLAAGAAPERRVPCAPGASVRDAGGTCEACAQGSYSTPQGCRACAGAGETTAGAYALDASACVCAPGLFRAPDGACTACPRGTFKSRVGDEAELCEACAAGRSRPGAPSKRLCSGGGVVLYEPALGAVGYHTPVQPRWTAPAPVEQPQDARCVAHAAGFSCPSGEHAQALRRVGAAWLTPEGREYVPMGTAPAKLRLWLRAGHSPAHAPDALFSQALAAFAPGTLLEHTLRMQVAGRRAHVVSMLTRAPLGAEDWQWLVCGQLSSAGAAPQYARCRARADPDAPALLNGENALVLDLAVRTLEPGPGTRSCMHPELGWQRECAADESTYEGAWAWTPNVAAHGGPVWAYTFVLLGESEACERFGCVEAREYQQLLSAEKQSTLAGAPRLPLALLPGFEVRVRAPPAPALADLVLAPDSGLRGGSEALLLSAELPAQTAGRSVEVQLASGLRLQDAQTRPDLLVYAAPRGAARPWEALLCARTHNVHLHGPQHLHLELQAGALKRTADPARQLYEGFQAARGVLPAPDTSALPACDLSEDLRAQPLPCAYTKAQVRARYAGLRGTERVHDGVAYPCSTGPLGGEVTTLTEFGKACAGGAADSCVCGVLREAWVQDELGVYARRVVRTVAPQPAGPDFVAVLSASDAAGRHVLAQGMTPPGAHLALAWHDPRAAHNTEAAHKAQYDVCAAHAGSAALVHAFEPSACCTSSDTRTCAPVCPGVGRYDAVRGVYTLALQVPAGPADLHVVALAPAGAGLCAKGKCDTHEPLGAAAFATASLVSRIGSSVRVRVSKQQAEAVPAVESEQAPMSPPARRTVRRTRRPAPGAAGMPKPAPTRQRRLLVAGTSSASGGTDPADVSGQTSVLRETQGLQTEQKLTNSRCKDSNAGTGDGHVLCAMLDVGIPTSASDYCLDDDALVAKKAAGLQAALRALSGDPEAVVKVAYVSRPNYLARCVLAPPARRRLLQDQVLTDNAYFKAELLTNKGSVLIDLHDKDKYGIDAIRLIAVQEDGKAAVQLCLEGPNAMCLNNLVTHSKNQTIVDTSRTAKDGDDAEDRMILILAIVITVFIVALAICILYRALGVRKQPSDEAEVIECTQMGPQSPYEFEGSMPLMSGQLGYAGMRHQGYGAPMFSYQ